MQKNRRPLQKPCRVANHLKNVIPVETAIINIVAELKYTLASTSIPTVNMFTLIQFRL